MAISTIIAEPLVAIVPVVVAISPWLRLDIIAIIGVIVMIPSVIAVARCTSST